MISVGCPYKPTSLNLVVSEEVSSIQEFQVENTSSRYKCSILCLPKVNVIFYNYMWYMYSI